MHSKRWFWTTESRQLVSADWGTMNVFGFIIALIASTVVAMLAAVRQSADARNVARLAEHFGWGRSDAAEAYASARRIGFGAAYRSLRARSPLAV